MSVGIKIGQGWVYLSNDEREKMNLILKVLDSKLTRIVSIFQLADKINRERQGVAHVVWMLVSAKILYVEQHSRARCVGLCPGWKTKINDIITYYNRDKISVTQQGDTKGIKPVSPENFE